MADKRYVDNKAHLMDPITRNRVIDSLFYKQHLYLTNEATVLPVITEHIAYLGGIDAMGRPSAMICCLLRLLELEPSVEIVVECLQQKEFKYLTALMMLYVRLVMPSAEVYRLLEPYYADYRKLRVQRAAVSQDDAGRTVRFALLYIDQWTERLLVEERAIGVFLPRLEARDVLEEAGEVEERLNEILVAKEEESSEYESDSD